jgi:Ca2+-transporting ATPase
MGKGGEEYGRRENSGKKNPSSQIVFPAWAKDVGECAANFEVNRDYGLSSEQVEKQQQIYGCNEMNWRSTTVHQFSD